MKNLLLAVAAFYGVGVSIVSGYGFFMIDMPQLEYAVKSKSTNAELRHRLNVSAEGNWILLGNLITVIAIAGIRSNSVIEKIDS